MADRVTNNRGAGGLSLPQRSRGAISVPTRSEARTQQQMVKQVTASKPVVKAAKAEPRIDKPSTKTIPVYKPFVPNNSQVPHQPVRQNYGYAPQQQFTDVSPVQAQQYEPYSDEYYAAQDQRIVQAAPRKVNSARKLKAKVQAAKRQRRQTKAQKQATIQQQVQQPVVQNAYQQTAPVVAQPQEIHTATVQPQAVPANVTKAKSKSGGKRLDRIKNQMTSLAKKAKSSDKPAEIEEERVKPSLARNILRYSIVAAILMITGYLAFDTWMANRQAHDFFSQPASALAGVGDVSEASISNEDMDSYKVKPDEPRYIKIPSIGVSARVMQVGLDSEGKIGVPSNINDTAWYNESAKPGKSGAMFIDGHMTGPTQNGVFNNIIKLKPNDTITIQRGDGEAINYAVKMVETVPVSQVDMHKVLSVYGKDEQGINLMTCADFDSSSQTFNDRTIVYAVRMN